MEKKKASRRVLYLKEIFIHLTTSGLQNRLQMAIIDHA